MQRKLWCHRLKKEALGMSKPPFPGQIGEEIWSKVSEQGWLEWRELQIKLINENRLDLSDKEHRQVLIEQMRQFLSLDDKDPA